MACCGGNTHQSERIANSQRDGWLLVAPAWGGMRNYWGLATRAFYGRVGIGVRFWADPADVAADPLLRPVEPEPAQEAEPTLETEPSPAPEAGPAMAATPELEPEAEPAPALTPSSRARG